MRSFIIVAALILGVCIAPDVTLPDSVSKFIAYAMIVGFIMDLIELFK